MIDYSSFDFLVNQKNNCFKWYHANKGWFKDYKDDFIDFVTMIFFRISLFDPSLTRARLKDSLFRIYKLNISLCVLN